MKRSIQSVMDTNIKSNDSSFLDRLHFIIDKIKSTFVFSSKYRYY